MKDSYDDYSPLAPTAAPLRGPTDPAPGLQLALWAASVQEQPHPRHTRFARQIEAAVLRNLVTRRH